MDNNDRINLQKILKQNDVEETTDMIRFLRHSDMIREDVIKMEKLKMKYSRLRETNKEQFDTICINQCNFMFTNYTMIYNKLKKGYLDVRILFSFLDTLKKIEDGKLDQHEGSYEVGKLLKKLYVDSALRESEQLENGRKTKKKLKPEKKISWNQFKNMDNGSKRD